MAEQHGGKRTPRNPAPVSGPGKLSRRTDGGPAQVNTEMTGMGYGENQDFNDMQSSAPMAASGGGVGAKAPTGPPPSGGVPSNSPLFSESRRPEEPVTAGASFGPGAGASKQPGSNEQANADAATIGKYLPDLMRMAEEEDTPAGFKRFVRHLRNVQGD